MESVIFEGKEFEVFIPEKEIKAITYRLAEEINKCYADLGKPLTLISILDGSFVFMADLIRQLNIDVKIQFVKLKSYEGTSSRGEVAHILKLQDNIEGEDLLIVEDIIDTGLTLEVFKEEISVMNPKSIRICTLLSKPEIHNEIVNIDFVGREIPPYFVIGYGLDINGKGRQLKDIYRLKI